MKGSCREFGPATGHIVESTVLSMAHVTNFMTILGKSGVRFSEAAAREMKHLKGGVVAS